MTEELKRLRAVAAQCRRLGEREEAEDLETLAAAIEHGPRESAVTMARIEAISDPDLRRSLTDLWETMNRD